MRSTLIRALAVFSAVAALVLSSGGPTPAHAAGLDPGASQEAGDIYHDLGLWNTFTQGLASDGPLGATLPGTGFAPGGANGLNLGSLLNGSLQYALDHQVSIKQCSDFAGLNGQTETVGSGTATLGASVSCSADPSQPDLIAIQLNYSNTFSAPLNVNSSAISVSSNSGISTTLNLHFHAAFGYVAGGATPRYFYLDPAQTTLTASVAGSIPSGTSIAAALGILGVTATVTTPFSISANFVAKVNDPSGTGKLAFTDPNGQPGALAQSNAAGSIFSIGWDKGQPNTLNGAFSVTASSGGISGLGALGSITGTVSVSQTDLSTGTPTVTVGGDFTSSTSALLNFNNLTPRDLGDGLATLAAAISAIQGSKVGSSGNVDLPFMHGKLSDALQVSEDVYGFLAKNVDQNTDQPSFHSVQDLSTALTGYTDGSGKHPFSGLSLNYEKATSKLVIGFGVERDPGTAINLDPGPHKLISGTVSSATHNTLTDTSASPSQWTPIANPAATPPVNGKWAGYTVVAGNSSATISTSSVNTLNLQSDWNGGIPPPGTPYTIETQDPGLGDVNLANAVSSLGGIVSANASIPLAQVNPTYKASVTFVLDLEKPVTGDGCKTFSTLQGGTGQACPFTTTNKDGSVSVVSSLPQAPDRIMIRTGSPLFVADAPITTAFHLDASAGFLKVHLDGALCEFTSGSPCALPSGKGATPPSPVGVDPNSTGSHLLSIDLKHGDASADSNGNYDMPLRHAFTLLTGDTSSGINPNPGSLIGVQMHGGGSAQFAVSVPPLTDFFSDPNPGASITVNDITGDLNDTGSGPPHNVQIQVTDLSKLVDFNSISSDPKALFRLLLAALTALDNQLQQSGSASSSFLTTKIPVINASLADALISSDGSDGSGVTYGGSSLSDSKGKFNASWLGRTISSGTDHAVVVGVTDATDLSLTAWTHQPANGAPYSANSELEAVLGIFAGSAPVTLQDMVDVLNKHLPSISGGPAIKFTVVDDATGNPKIDLSVNWKKSFQRSLPIGFNFDFGGGTGTQSLGGVGASGDVSVSGSVQLNLDLLVALTLDTTKHCAIGNPTDVLCVGANNSIFATLSAGAKNVSIHGTFGPVSVALGNPSSPDANIQAAFNAGISQSGATTTGSEAGVGIADYFSHLKVNVNQSTLPDGSSAPAASCGSSVDVSGHPLSVCAFLPLYVSTDAGKTFKQIGSGDALLVRLPQIANDPNAFSLAGTVDGTTPRFAYPSNLLIDFANAVLDLNDLNGGLDGYFQFAENALNLASAGGKLPLLGKDLQEGADFLTDLQSRIDSILGPAASVSTVGDVQSKIDDLASNLNSSSAATKLNATVSASIICAGSGNAGAIQSPAIGGVSNAGTAGTSEYTYQVFGVLADGTIIAANGNKSSSSTAPDTLGDGTGSNPKPNVISWTTSSSFSKYIVYRSGVSGPANGKYPTGVLSDSVTSGSYSDTGAAPSSTSAPTATSAPPCASAATLASGEMTGITITLDASKGDITTKPGCQSAGSGNGKDCITAFSVPLNIGIPGLSISAGDQGGDPANQLNAAVGYKFHLSFGLDRNLGFFLNVPSDGVVLGLGVSLNVPNSTIKANVAFLQVCLAPHTASPDFNGNPDYPCNVTASGSTSVIGASFTVKMQAPSGSAHPSVVTLNDLSSHSLGDIFTPTFSAGLNLDLDFQVDVGSTQTLPGIGGEFLFKWTWSNAPANSGTEDDMANHTADSGNDLEFKGVYISAGKFFSGVFGEVVKEVQQVTQPLKPIIDVITAPIPLLSDLSHIAGGPDITLITLAKSFSTLVGGPNLSFIDTVIGVIKTISSLNLGSISNSLHISIGSFKPLGAAGAVFHGAATPDVSSPAASGADAEINTEGDLNGNAFGDMDSASGSGALSKSANKESSGPSSGQTFGISFPVLKKPASLFNLLMNKDVTLVKFDSGPLSLGFSYSQQFGPVYAPPPVMVVISGSASITARVVLGFDTFGFRQAAAGNATLVGFLNSLFIITQDDNGKPIPAILLQGTLAAGAEVSAVIISVGIEGGIQLTIALLWNDSDNDGKFRFSEIVGKALINPLCLFNFSGSLNFFLQVFIDIGISPFDYSFNFTIIDLTLLDFSSNHSCDQPAKPPVLAAIAGNVLYVFAGRLGDDSLRNQGWGNGSGQAYAGAQENVVVQELHDGSHKLSGFNVSLLSHQQTFDATGVDRVVVDARGYSGNENILFTGDNNAAPGQPAFDLGAVVLGGNGKDTIKDPSPATTYVSDGNGDDKIQLGDGNDMIAVGSGNDQVKTGNGNNWVGGDTSLNYSTFASEGKAGPTATEADGKTTINLPADLVDANASITAPAAPVSTAGGKGEHMNLGRGSNTVWGGGGGNQISVAPDSPLAVFPSGDPRRAKCEPSCTDGNNFIVGGAGGNVITAGTGTDVIFAGSYATAGSDLTKWTGVAGDHDSRVDTGVGNKLVFGSGAKNLITGHSRQVVPAGQTPPPNQKGGIDCHTDLLNAYLAAQGRPIGAVTYDANKPESDCVTAGGSDSVIQGGDGHDYLYGGDDSGNDIIRGGAGVDHIYASTHGDNILVSVSGHSFLTGGAGDDYLFGGDATFLDSSGNPTSIASFPIRDAKSVADPFGFRIDPQFGKDRHLDVIPVAVPSTPGGQQILVGNGGNNHIFASDNGDLVFGGEQHNESTCQPQRGQPLFTPPAKLADTGVYGGHYGNNTIVGGLARNQKDQVTGGQGANWIQGGGGSAYLCGGGFGIDHGGNAAFHTTIHGGSGNVVIWNGGGDSSLYGDSGNDLIFGNGGNTTIIGGLGSIYAEGNGGSDLVVGGSGRNVLIGGSSVAGTADQDLSPNSQATAAKDAHKRIFGGPQNDILIGNNGCAAFASPAIAPAFLLTPPACSAGPIAQVFLSDLQADTSNLGSGDQITAQNGDNIIFGGLGDNTISAGFGRNYIEGGTGNNTITVGGGDNAIIGGSSYPRIDSRTNNITTGDGKNVVIGNNGCVDNAVMPQSCVPGTPAVAMTAFGRRPVLQVYDFETASSKYGTGDNISVGNGGDLVIGGVSSNHIVAGDGDNYLEGGPGGNFIAGGHGSNDIIGGTAPLGLPGGVTTAMVATSSVNHVYADGGTRPVSGSDGTNVVIANNGSITRDSPFVTLTNRDGVAFVQRHVTLLDEYDLGGSAVVGRGPAGAGSWLFGGTSDDILLGGPGDDHIFGGPPMHLGTCQPAPNAASCSGFTDNFDCATAPADCNFDPTLNDGNDYVEGGPGINYLHGGAGDDDIIGGSSTRFLDSTANHPAGDPAAAEDPRGLTSFLSSGRIGAASLNLGNWIWGGAGGDYLLGANGEINHSLDPVTGSWLVNLNDHTLARSVFVYDLATAAGSPPCTATQPSPSPAGCGIGGGSHIWGEAGDDHVYGENGNNYLDGGPGNNYLEGGTGSNQIMGGTGANDIVGGSAPSSLPPSVSGLSNDDIAGALPSGSNIICGNYCGVDTADLAATGNVIIGHNGNVSRCADAGGVHQGWEACAWKAVIYGDEKMNCKGATAPCQADGTLTTRSLGNPLKRYIDLLGQSTKDSIGDGSTYIEGNSGDNVIYAEDGTSVIHGGTSYPNSFTMAGGTCPAAGCVPGNPNLPASFPWPTGAPAPLSPNLDECIPFDPAHDGNNVIVGGYGSKVICGGAGDNLIIGTRGDYSIVPYAASVTTIGKDFGPPFATQSYPSSGNTIYQNVDLTQELGKTVGDWQQDNGWKIIFGGGGNNAIHAGAGNRSGQPDVFVEGGHGIPIAGNPTKAAPDGDSIIFGGFGDASIEGGSGNTNIYGGSGADDIDVIRDDSGVLNKVATSGGSLPPLFPTINADPRTFGVSGRQSYASRFPLPAGMSYGADDTAASHGGTTPRTTTIGNVIYGGSGRDVMQIAPGDYGTRLIDESGNYNLFLLCPAYYGQDQIIRAKQPALKQFIVNLATADGATNPDDVNSSGFQEVSWAAHDHGSAYPGTPGHFHC